ncbi:hypothetical protein HY621_03735 [Candidatus Uhrbacteria bacterium]|nr:hypothetical protein [Candidatus Uhrbacteria bacterium]
MRSKYIISLVLLSSLLIMSIGIQLDARQKSVKKPLALKKTVKIKNVSTPKIANKKAAAKKITQAKKVIKQKKQTRKPAPTIKVHAVLPPTKPLEVSPLESISKIILPDFKKNIPTRKIDSPRPAIQAGTSTIVLPEEKPVEKKQEEKTYTSLQAGGGIVSPIPQIVIPPQATNAPPAAMSIPPPITSPTPQNVSPVVVIPAAAPSTPLQVVPPESVKPPSPYRAKLTTTSCNKTTEQFKQTGEVICGRIKWKLFAEHARLMADPLPYLQRYDEFYGFLKDLVGDEPSGKQIILEEKEGEVTLNANSVTSTIRLVPEWVANYFAQLANSPNNRLSGSLAHEMGHIFTLISPNKDVLMWGPPLIEAYADIPALFGYLAAIESVPGFQKDFFYWDGYCEKVGKPRYCDEGFSSVAEYISVGHLRDLQEYIDRGETFDTLFPVPDTIGEVHKRAGKFSTMLMNMYLDFVKRGKGLQFYDGLKDTLQLYQKGTIFPESLKNSIQSNERLAQKSNLFIFLLSSNIKEDLSSRFEGYRFTVSAATKKAITEYAQENYNPIRLQYYVNVLLGITTTPQLQTQTPSAVGTGTGLEGLYFNDENLSNFVTIRVDPKIDFNWGWSTPPAPAMPYDHYSIRWTGFIEPRYTDTYTFHTIADDGARLWVHNTKLIDDWTVHGPTELTGTINLEAGKKYPIKLEYYDWQYGASVQLLWSSANQQKEVIPQKQLYDPAKVGQ